MAAESHPESRHQLDEAWAASNGGSGRTGVADAVRRAGRDRLSGTGGVRPRTSKIDVSTSVHHCATGTESQDMAGVLGNGRGRKVTGRRFTRTRNQCGGRARGEVPCPGPAQGCGQRSGTGTMNGRIGRNLRRFRTAASGGFSDSDLVGVVKAHRVLTLSIFGHPRWPTSTFPTAVQLIGTGVFPMK